MLAIKFPWLMIGIIPAFALGWSLLRRSRLVALILRKMRSLQSGVSHKDAPTARIVGDVYVLHLLGTQANDETNELEKRVKEALYQGHLRILIDLSDVNYVDSTFIANLIACYTMVERAGGQLKLLGLTSRVQSFYKLPFETYDNENAAVTAFKS